MVSWNQKPSNSDDPSPLALIFDRIHSWRKSGEYFACDFVMFDGAPSPSLLGSVDFARDDYELCMERKLFEMYTPFF